MYIRTECLSAVFAVAFAQRWFCLSVLCSVCDKHVNRRDECKAEGDSDDCRASSSMCFMCVPLGLQYPFAVK